MIIHRKRVFLLDLMIITKAEFHLRHVIARSQFNDCSLRNTLKALDSAHARLEADSLPALPEDCCTLVAIMAAIIEAIISIVARFSFIEKLLLFFTVINEMMGLTISEITININHIELLRPIRWRCLMAQFLQSVDSTHMVLFFF